jgi:hypothetical protein
MSSDQLHSLAKLAPHLGTDFVHLVWLLLMADRDDPPPAFTSRDFAHLSRRIKERLDAAMLLVFLYLLPSKTASIATSLTEHPHSCIHKSWLVSCNQSLILARHHFEVAAKAFDNQPAT